jgi:hypothetical protein
MAIILALHRDLWEIPSCIPRVPAMPHQAQLCWNVPLKDIAFFNFRFQTFYPGT